MAIFDDFTTKGIKGFGEDWREFNGAEVQKFIEAMIADAQRRIEQNTAQKVGEISSATDENGVTTLRFFADADSRDKWETDPAANATLCLGSISFSSSAAGSDDYTLATRVTKLPTSPVVKGSENTLTFSYNSYYGGDPTNLDTEAGQATVSINGTEIDALRLTLRPGGEYTIDLGQYLTAEQNTVTLTVANAHGKRRVFNLTVQTVELTVSFDDSFDQTTAKSSGWPLRVAAKGVPSTVHLLIDGTEVSTASVSNATVDFTVDRDGSMGVGAHSIEVYAENADYGITSNSATAQFIKAGGSRTTVCIGQGADTAVPLYGTARVPYFAYWPGAGAADSVTATARVLDKNGKVLMTASQSVSFRADGTSGLQTLHLQLADPACLDSGTVTVEIDMANTTAPARHTIKVTDPGVNLSAAAECKAYLSAAGRSNADTDADDWHSEYDGKRTCTVRRSANFRLGSGSGFTGSSFYIPAGRRITLDGFLPFATDFGANNADPSQRTGKTIEFEFATRNVTDSSATVIECMNGGVGFRICADGMTLSTASGSVRTIWSDETKIRVGIVVEGTTRHCVNKTVGGTTSLDANLAYIYVNGVAVRLMDYKTASWKQPAPQPVTIGSDDCDVECYVAVRGFDKALTSAQMIGNWAYDTPEAADKIAIARRNDILNAYGEVDFAKVREALPSTPYKIWEIPVMPTGKKDWQTASTEFVNPGWEPSEDALENASFTCTGHQLALDGTSSLSYPDPYKNWANRYGKGQWSVTVGDTVITIHGYSITPGVEGEESDYVDKVNFASSEGYFNILAAHAYHNIMMGVAQSYPSILTPMQAAQQSTGPVSFRQSLSGYPIIGWLREYANGVPSVRFLSIYNFINNKYSGSYLGATRANGAEIWEVEDNVNFFMEHCDEGTWKNGSYDDRLTTLYYARFPKTDEADNDWGKASAAEGVAEANRQSRHLRAFHNWVQSCNPTVADRYKAEHGAYAPLPTAQTFGSVTYTEDSPDYRVARFRAEAPEWMDKPNAMFYFLMFTAMLGVDSMDKNYSIFLTKDN